jgi:hypothetical protein
MSVGTGRDRGVRRAGPYSYGYKSYSASGKRPFVPKNPVNRHQKRAAARLAGKANANA